MKNTTRLVIPEPCILPETVGLDERVIEEGGVPAAPSGYALALTVNGAAVDVSAGGSWTGSIVVTPG